MTIKNLYPSVRPTLDLNFAQTKQLHPLITFSRSSIGTYFDNTGVLRTAGANQARFDHNPVTGESLGLLVEEMRSNLLLNSGTLATQSVTVTATTYWLSFYGTGSITLSGASTAGPLVGTGANDRVVLDFTPTAGTLTLSVAGTVTNAQLEAGFFPTSYIPTAASTATRAADVAQITGANFSSWYNQSEGTWFASGGSYVTGRINSFFADKSSDLGLEIFNDPTIWRGMQGATAISSTAGTPIVALPKAALAYTENGTAIVAANGRLGTANPVGSFPKITDLLINRSPRGTASDNWKGAIARLAYYPVRLPNATLQALTL